MMANTEPLEVWEKYHITDVPLSKAGNSLVCVIQKKVLNAVGLKHGDVVRVLLKRKDSESLE